MVELAHDGSLGQEVPPLALGVAGLERLDGHHHLPAAGLLEAAAAHLAEFTWAEGTRGGVGGSGRGGGDEGEWAGERGGRVGGQCRGEGPLLGVKELT